MVKTVLTVLGIVLLSLLGYLAYAYHGLKVQSAEAARTRSELEAGYQARLAQYQRDLPIGMRRSQVQAYLDSHGITYADWRGQINVDLGREPDVFPCNYWTVYVAFDFAMARKDEASADDLLRSISLKRIGHCL